ALTTNKQRVLLIIKFGSFLSNIKKLKYVLQQCVNKTKGMEEGALNLMLLNAKGNSETMSFEIKGRVLSDGQYLQVQVSTECVLES
ncbi:MAG: hypothetical protein ACKVIM_09345, partial [Flavobacteriales bacterium]